MKNRTSDVAVVGAGVAGLAAARALQAAGFQVVVHEQAALPGGRLATDYYGPCAFDYGAQNIKAAGTELEPCLAAALARGEATVIPGPVCLHEAGQILPADPVANQEAKSAGRHGLANLASTLADGLDIRYNTPVRALEAARGGYELCQDGGAPLSSAPHVILSLPAPAAANLLRHSRLEESGEATAERIKILRGVNYSRCLAVSLHYNFQSELPFYALLARDRAHPLLWLAHESAKPGNEAGTSFVAQLGQASSEALWDAPQIKIVSETTVWIAELLGPGYLHPAWHQVRQWLYSHPLNPVPFEGVNPAGTRLLVCGDGTARGRVPEAYASGLQAAARIIKEIDRRA